MTAAALDAHVVVARSRFTVDVELEVPAGGTLAVMGPSGAGKSTLLQALAGLVRLDAGAIRLGGDLLAGGPSGVHREPAARGISLLGQDPRLFPHLSVRENIAFGPRARGVAARAARADAEVWLERVGIAGTGELAPDALSGGQQQRVALARALAVEPRLLLLDEPLTSLDVATAAEIRVLLRAQLATTGVTSVVVSHDAADAVGIAERLVIVEDGALVQEGAVAEVLAAPRSRFAAAVAAAHRFDGEADSGQTGPQDRPRA